MHVLVSVGMELIFFLVPALCFGFSIKIEVVTHWYFRCCGTLPAESSGLLWFLHCPDSEEDTTSQDRWSKLSKGMAHAIRTIKLAELAAAVQGLDGHQSKGGEQMHCALIVLFVLLFVFYRVFPSICFYQFLIKLFYTADDLQGPSQPYDFIIISIFSFDSLSHNTMEGRSELPCGDEEYS